MSAYEDSSWELYLMSVLKWYASHASLSQWIASSQLRKCQLLTERNRTYISVDNISTYLLMKLNEASSSHGWIALIH